MLRAPESRPRALPYKRCHDEHLAGVARPDDQEQRVIAHQIFRRCIERRKAYSGEQKQRQRAAERMDFGHELCATWSLAKARSVTDPAPTRTVYLAAECRSRARHRQRISG